MANFLKNAWAKVKKPLVAVTKVAGNIVGAPLGLKIGDVAGGLLNKIPVATMAKKAAESGKVDENKVVETLQANGIKASPSNVKAATQAIQTEVVESPEIDKQQKLPVEPASAAKVGVMYKIREFFHTHWYLGIIIFPAVVVIGYKLLKRK